MKKIVYLLFLFFMEQGVTYGQVGKGDFYCPFPQNGGNNNPLPTPPPSQTPAGSAATSAGVSADPNEIIGPTGFDSLRWVSINDILTYTIMFENAPEFATANAQKVDVHFTFDDKAYIKGFGLNTFGFV